jgi:hypothetical protein
LVPVGLAATAAGVAEVVAGVVCTGCWITGDGCTVTGALVAGCRAGGAVDEPGAASGWTRVGAGSGAGPFAAGAEPATTSSHNKMIALHPAGRPPRLRLGGAGADCATTIQVTPPPMSCCTSNPTVSPHICGVNTSMA